MLEFLAGAATLSSLWVDLSLSGFNVFDLCAVLWIDIFFVVLYTFFYAGLSRSVSVTLLSRLFTIRESSLDFDALLEEYDRSSRFEDRIHLMEESGLVSVSGNSVHLTSKGFALARGAKLLGGVFGDGLRG